MSLFFRLLNITTSIKFLLLQDITFFRDNPYFLNNSNIKEYCP